MEPNISSKYALVVEGHPLLAASIASCVESCSPGLEVLTVDTMPLAEAVLRVRPDPVLLVTDLGMTDANGIAALRRLHAAAPQSPLLIFTALEDAAIRIEVLAMGGTAYLGKNSSILATRDAITSIVGAVSTVKLLTSPPPDALTGLLTPKQLRVLEKLPSGGSNREIAAQLWMSEETVRSHMKEILSRLGVRNRTEGVARYLRLLQEARDAA